MTVRSFFKKIISPFRHWALLLILLPVLELFFMLQFFSRSQWLILLSMLIGGVFGVFVARRECMRHWIELNQLLDHGKFPMVPIINGMLVILGALFMVMPGLLSCLLGLFLLFPLTRFLVATHILLQFEAHRLRTQQRNAHRSPEIIDV